MIILTGRRFIRQLLQAKKEKVELQVCTGLSKKVLYTPISIKVASEKNDA